MRVLLIEDDSALANSIKLMLKSENFNVYVTNLGEDGVDLGKIYDYDIILLDLNLPDISGFEVLRTLRMARISTPVCILSGMSSIEDKVRGLGYGADDYISKPLNKDELVARIHAIVRRSISEICSNDKSAKGSIAKTNFLGTPNICKAKTRCAVFLAKSPMRSKSAAILIEPTISRKSDAIGWRLAIVIIALSPISLSS